MEVEDTKRDDTNLTVSHTVKWWIGSYILLAIGFIILYILSRWNIFNLNSDYREIINKITLVGFFSSIVLIFTKWIESVINNHASSKGAHYNIIRLVKLLAFIIIVLIAMSFFFENWYTAAVSLGLISLILGFALQTPISSIIGWLYIVIRTPYHVGDRIQIDAFTGDVVEISYLDTTLWEFGGDYLTNDLPSGRLIRFPNSLIFTSAVFNYSWKKFPFIWNEIPFHVAYESDLAYVENILRSVTKRELGPEMAERVQHLKTLIEQTPLDEHDIKEYPFVCFRTNANTWVEALVIYLVHPKQASGIRTRIIKAAIGELLKNPDKVMFPKSNAR